MGCENNNGTERWQNRLPKWRNPPTFNQKRKYFGRNLVKLYKNQFEIRVKNQPHFAELTLHCIIGQLPSVKKMRIIFGGNELDLRISGCFFKPSGSGGGRGFNFMAEVARQLDITYQPVTEITDAALIGSVDVVKEYDPTKKGMVKISKIDRGALDPTPEDGHKPINIVAMSEADLLFSGSTTDYKRNAMMYYQIALNTMGTEDNKLTKKLAHGEWIEFNPDCSLMFVSYPPDNFYETIVKKGFLQRLLILYSSFSTQDRIEVAKVLTQSLGEDHTSKKDMDNLIKRLNFVNEYWSTRYDETITIEQKAVAVLTKIVDEFFDCFEDVDNYPQKKMEEFTQRWLEHVWRIAWHHMILRLDNTLTLEDVGYAKAYIMPLWKKLIGLLEEGIRPTRDKKRRHRKMLTEAIKLYQDMCEKRGKKSGARIPRSDFVNTLKEREYWSVSYKTSSTRVRKFEDEGWFERSYKGSAPMIELSRLPKWLKT